MVVQLAAVLCTATIWFLGSRYDRVGVQKDLRWVFLFWYAVTPWSNRGWVYKAWTFDIWWVYFFCQGQKRETEDTEAETQKLVTEIKDGLCRSDVGYNDARSTMKPLLFPCQTSHTRLFPKKHSFSYSYLFVGIPVGWRGYVSTVLSADLKTLPWSHCKPENCWFNVDAADYLARGENLHGLQGKLDEYLESQVGYFGERAR